jgi:hypothetical protein
MLEHLLQSAKIRGYITSQEVLELYPDAEDCIPQIDELFARLIDEGVEIVMVAKADQTAEEAEDEDDADVPADAPEVLVESDDEPAEVDVELDDDDEPDAMELQDDLDSVSEVITSLDGIAADDTVSLYLKQMGSALLTAEERSCWPARSRRARPPACACTASRFPARIVSTYSRRCASARSPAPVWSRPTRAWWSVWPKSTWARACRCWI